MFGYVHPFLFCKSPRDSTRLVSAHQTLDGDASRELVAALTENGYRYGDAFINMRDQSERGRHLDDRELLEVDVSHMRRGDVILQTTRPPLDDLELGDQKRVDRGHTTLEAALFVVWRKYLSKCARSTISLAPEIRASLDPDDRNRSMMAFGQRTGADLRQVNDCVGSGWKRYDGGKVTVAFVLRTDEIWEAGPGLLGAWGMDGLTTLGWAYRLRKDFTDLLLTPGFRMVELELGNIPVRPTNLAWAREWKIRSLIDRQL